MRFLCSQVIIPRISPLISLGSRDCQALDIDIGSLSVVERREAMQVILDEHFKALERHAGFDSYDRLESFEAVARIAGPDSRIVKKYLRSDA